MININNLEDILDSKNGKCGGSCTDQQGERTNQNNERDKNSFSGI